MNSDLKKSIDKAASRIKPSAENLCALLHANPETGLCEYRALQFFRDTLAGLGFGCSAPRGGLPTAFRSESGKDAPAVAFCAEYDALAENGHACGHNLIAAAALTAYSVTAAVIAETGCGGRAVLMGTPAEESYGGKCDLLRAGEFSGLTAVFGCHPYKYNAVDFCDMAVRRFDVTFYGRAAHAASAPESGINALDAMTLLWNGIGCFRQQMEPETRFHGMVSEGGKSPNIIPERTKAVFYLRGACEDAVDRLEKRLRDMVRGAAVMTGCRSRVVKLPNSYTVNRRYPELEKLLSRSMTEFGIAPESSEPWMASTDFANVSLEIPAVNLFFRIAPPGKSVALHTREFAGLAGTPYAFEQAFTAGKVMAAAALRLMLPKNI